MYNNNDSCVCTTARCSTSAFPPDWLCDYCRAHHETDYEIWTEQCCPDDAPDGRCWDCRAHKSEPHRLGCPKLRP